MVILLQAWDQPVVDKLGRWAHLHHPMPTHSWGVVHLWVHGIKSKWNFLLACTCSLVASHGVWCHHCPPQGQSPLCHPGSWNSPTLRYPFLAIILQKKMFIFIVFSLFTLHNMKSSSNSFSIVSMCQEEWPCKITSYDFYQEVTLQSMHALYNFKILKCMRIWSKFQTPVGFVWTT